MRCPACDEYVPIEDWDDDSPFQCEECGEWIRLVIDESTYKGATDKYLEVVDE